MSEDLTQRIAAIEAREEIRDLVTRYGMAVDDRDLATVATLFTEDAVFRHGDDSIVNNGRQEIVDFYKDRLSAFGPTYHYPHSHIVAIDDASTATGIVNAHAELAVEDRSYVTALRYYDHYRHDEGSWRFAERRVAMLYYMDMADLGAGGLALADRKRYFGTVGPSDIPEKLTSWQRFFAEASS